MTCGLLCADLRGAAPLRILLWTNSPWHLVSSGTEARAKEPDGSTPVWDTQTHAHTGILSDFFVRRPCIAS